MEQPKPTPFPSQQEADELTPIAPERVAAKWVSRITSVAGLICLALALTVWAARPGHYRFVLAMLTIAMFAAILHSYTFENGNGA
jgi:hypothetical protein